MSLPTLRRVEFLGSAIEEFEDLAIALACIHLFERADEEGYARNLQLCGFARQHFLRRTRAEIDDVYSAASRAQGDLAAFIAGDDALVRDIVALAATEPLAGEYEDDFRYRKILHDLMVAPAQIDEGALALLIDGFESARNGAEATRYALCVAFRDVDEDAFWSAFQDLHNEVKEQRASPPRTDEPWPEIWTDCGSKGSCGSRSFAGYAAGPRPRRTTHCVRRGVTAESRLQQERISSPRYHSE